MFAFSEWDLPSLPWHGHGFRYHLPPGNPMSVFPLFLPSFPWVFAAAFPIVTLPPVCSTVSGKSFLLPLRGMPQYPKFIKTSQARH